MNAKILLTAIAVLPLSKPLYATSNEYNNCLTNGAPRASCAVEEYDRQDAQLNKNYKMLMRHKDINSKELRADQRQWIKFRDNQCPDKEMRSGHAFILQHNCLASVTEARVALFEEALAVAYGTNSKPQQPKPITDKEMEVDIQYLVAEMMLTYGTSGTTGMTNNETRCWNNAKQREVHKASECLVKLTSGQMIDVIGAREEIRGVYSFYNQKNIGVRALMNLKKLGFSQSEIELIIKNSDNKRESIIVEMQKLLS